MHIVLVVSTILNKQMMMNLNLFLEKWLKFSFVFDKINVFSAVFGLSIFWNHKTNIVLCCKFKSEDYLSNGKDIERFH